MTKSGTALKGTFWQLFFNLLKHRWVLKQKLYFRRTHFNGYFSSSNIELQTEKELKIFPTYLLTCLLTELFFTISDHLIVPCICNVVVTLID